jgi:hypothetical protein
MGSIIGIFKPRVSKDIRKLTMYKRIGNMEKSYKEKGIEGEDLERKMIHVRLVEMDKFERGVFEKYLKVSDREKKVLHQNLCQSWMLSSFTNEDGTCLQLPNKVRSHEDFGNYVIRTNLFGVVFHKLQEFVVDQRYPCELVPDNFAWISKDEKGIYRYFSKMKEGRTIGLNIIDLMEIIHSEHIGSKEGFLFIIRWLATILGASYRDYDWEQNQLRKYETNIEVIDQLEVSSDYPVLSRFITTYLDLLKTMNKLGKDDYLSTIKRSYKGHSVFYVSSTYLEKVLKVKQATVIKVINMFALLGLIIKPDPWGKGFPKELLDKSEEVQRQKKRKGVEGRKIINHYVIPLYTESLLTRAEKMVCRLKKNGVTNATLGTKTVIAQIFGEKTAKSIYYKQTKDWFLDDSYWNMDLEMFKPSEEM